MSLTTQVSILALALAAAAAPAPLTANAGIYPRQSNGTGKRGVPYNDPNLGDLFIGQGQISFAYNYASSSSGLGSGINYVPTLWGADSGHTNDWNTNAAAAIAAGSNTLFSFNEPDNSGQSNLTPTDAATAWMTYMEPFAGQASLCAPSVTNSVQPNQGFDWLNQFLTACSTCTIDCIAVHWYSPPTATQYFEDYVNNATAYGKPVWLNEFAVSMSGNILTDASQVDPFLESEMPFLDANEGVAGYAYFYAASGYLVENGAISDYGSVFANYVGGSTS